MKEPGSVYIEKANCRKCYRCVRECDLKAIQIRSEGVAIDQSRCIACGACISVCRAGRIKLRNDSHIARETVKRNDVIVASVSPQWVTEFEGVAEEKLIEALRLLGFTHVSESALGAEYCEPAEFNSAAEQNAPTISSRCPAVVNYINKTKPRLRTFVSQVISPMVAHARMVKRLWGQHAQVVHISACIAAKQEAEAYPGLLAAVLTFRELKQWLKNEGIGFDKMSGKDSYVFEPYRARDGHKYILCGNARKTGILPIAASSVRDIRNTLENFPADTEYPVWLDLMACEGGCLGSNGSVNRRASRIAQTSTLSEFARTRKSATASYRLPLIETSVGEYTKTAYDTFVPETDTQAALNELGLGLQAYQTDCDACGFGTCRRFAKALSRGDVTREMCWQYLGNESVSRFTALISRMSSGVAIVGRDGTIELANRMLASLGGPDAELKYDNSPGLTGVPVNDILPVANIVAPVIENGEDSRVRDIQVYDKILTVSVYTVQKYRTALVICRNMLFSQVRNEEIAMRTRKVIDENLETVRKIAMMLGENASRTEAILNSILNAQVKGDEN